MALASRGSEATVRPVSHGSGGASERHKHPSGMHRISSRYRRAGGANLIEINLATLDQLFNTLDPSPFHQKDLDVDAEDYIVGAARELPSREPLKLVLHIPREQVAKADIAGLARSIQDYFAYRQQTATRDLRFLFRQGRVSLLIGLTFLAVCLLLRQFLLASGSTLQHVLAESLLIAGWVAMWRPLEIFLYDWWPLRQMKQVYAKLASAPVEAAYTDEAAPATLDRD
jgi:hypothetical protein